MATLKAIFLPDGSLKIEVSGDVDATVHDAVQADLDALVSALGGDVKTESLGPEEVHVHSHGGHVHAHGGGRKS